MSEQSERVAVRTYVPSSQQSVWAEEADSMDMSLSEFVRSMVQAGRREFGLDGSPGDGTATPEEPQPVGSNPRGHALEDRVLAALESEGVASWDDLVGALSDDFEDQLETALDALMDAGEIEMDHRRGGYRLRGGE